MEDNWSPTGNRLLALLVGVFIATTLSTVRSPAQSNSQARIVRLSFVEGTVTLYRPDVDEWAQAYVNTPIQQGFKVATNANSFAEVEFENGSTARLGQLSELDFTDLSLSPDGGKINRLALARGYATFAVTPERGDVYQIRAAGSTFGASNPTMFRVDMDQGSQRLEVFKGEVGIKGPYGSGTVATNQVAKLNPGSADPVEITNGITEDAWDRWVTKRQQTQAVAGNQGGPGGVRLSAGSSLYGWNDLSYFGVWNDLPGYGSCWSPMMGAGWSPYSIGRWSWYPGFGYTWISGLPWGWLPFHYGSWIYPAGAGWCWLPGNFSSWSPGLVTWYQGPNWIGWAPHSYPRPYPGRPRRPVRCPGGQNCVTSVSFNTFQSGRPVLPNDVVRINPLHGHLVTSPTVPLTRGLRLPGPALRGSPFASTSETVGDSGARSRRIGAAPTRVFPRGPVRGAWDVRSHSPAVLNRQTNRNNDRLLPSRTALGRTDLRQGSAPGQLTSIPISSMVTREGATHHASSVVPTARPSGGKAGIRPFQEPRMSTFRPRRNRSMENSQLRRHMRINRRSSMPQQRVQRAPASRPSWGEFGGGRSMGRSSAPMGGGMRRGGGGSHGPSH